MEFFGTRRERTVALKRLKPGVESDTDYQERFRRESSLAARLSSPHVIPIHDFGEINGRLFIDMRLALGPDLGKLITMSGPLFTERVVEIVRQIADALDSAHEEGLIHRDVKSANVLVTNNHGQDFVYLVDFGIVCAVTGIRSSLTATGSAIGTLTYMVRSLSVTRPDVGPGLDPAISRAMAKDPRSRFDTAGELAKAAHACPN